MGLLERFFGNSRGHLNSKSEVSQHENAVRLLECGEFIDNVLNSNRYIARSEYIDKLAKYSSDIEFYDVLKKSGMVEDFCKKNKLTISRIDEITYSYVNMQDLVDQHNEKFVEDSMIKEKDYLDNVLKNVDRNIVLDEDQRRVVLTDEDYCLVIAGAGAGKTTTVAAKVKYLVDKQGIDPRQILVISYTNKAVNELKEKIQKNLGIDCPIATFN